MSAEHFISKDLQKLIEQTIGEVEEPKYVFTDEDTAAINSINKELMADIKKYDTTSVHLYKYNVVKNNDGSAVFHYGLKDINLYLKFFPGKMYAITYDSFYHTAHEQFNTSKELVAFVHKHSAKIAQSMNNVTEFRELKSYFDKI